MPSNEPSVSAGAMPAADALQRDTADGNLIE
jgi:hypothetical protein